MKKLLFSVLMLLITINYSFSQSFDWNIRAGINIMDSKTSGKDVSVLYHAGAEAGVRITNFGFYGEALYSAHENQYGGDPVGYFVPAILMKGYMRKILFGEMGGALALKIDDSGIPDDTRNPESIFYAFAGMGLHISKFDLSFRANLKQSYAIMQVTAAVKF
ncbi:MAG: hypothetical protein A2V64_08310 [Bacteroidetes bacterium RBG_13_43_22]|nr:MAG: hypothetical protein A2V64_08310 [Bacteroidetes bacterium RBG_13_43_22]